MKKLLIGCLIFISACQSATATPRPESSPTAAHQTPTTAATVTPTLTATPVYTATPFPLFFSEEFDTGLSAWVSFIATGDSAPGTTLENGSLKLAFSSPNTWYYAIHNAHSYSHVHADVKFSSTDTETTSLGLVCMYSERTGWLEYNISSDGTYSVLFGQALADGIAKYTPIAHDSTEYLSRGRTDYEIGMTCEQDVLWLYIEGKLFRKMNVSRYGLKEGKVGIAAGVFENIPVNAYFEWFRVSEPAE